MLFDRRDRAKEKLNVLFFSRKQRYIFLCAKASKLWMRCLRQMRLDWMVTCHYNENYDFVVVRGLFIMKRIIYLFFYDNLKRIMYDTDAEITKVSIINLKLEVLSVKRYFLIKNWFVNGLWEKTEKNIFQIIADLYS